MSVVVEEGRGGFDKEAGDDLVKSREAWGKSAKMGVDERGVVAGGVQETKRGGDVIAVGGGGGGGGGGGKLTVDSVAKSVVHSHEASSSSVSSQLLYDMFKAASDANSVRILRT